MTREETPMAYAGYCQSCGAMVAATVDRPEYKREVARDIARYVRLGLRVERVTVEAVKTDPAFGRSDACPTIHQRTDGRTCRGKQP